MLKINQTIVYLIKKQKRNRVLTKEKRFTIYTQITEIFLHLWGFRREKGVV